MTENIPSGLPEGGKGINVNIPVWHSTVYGLYALLNWLDGFEASGKGNIPGHFELTMHFRGLMNAIISERKENQKAPE